MFFSEIKKRRHYLNSSLDIGRRFSTYEESCLPSYVHSNVAAAWVAWRRLQVAAGLYKEFGSPAPVLDFGSSTGELFRFLGAEEKNYHFVEQNKTLSGFLKKELPRAGERTAENLPHGHYGAVFALDSLEHNDNVEFILKKLHGCLSPGGILILSGPTENFLYKLGRKISGFKGHYHKTDIYRIEHLARGDFERISTRTVPFGIPLFSISAWKKK